MHHSGGPLVRQQPQGVLMSLPVVDDDREIQLHGQHELPFHPMLLRLPRAGVLVMIIQPDLPHRHHLRPTAQQAQLLFLLLPRRAGVFRMDTRRRADIRIPFGQGDTPPGGCQAVRRADNPLHPSRRKGVQQFLPVPVEGLRVIMGVRIKNSSRHAVSFLLILPVSSLLSRPAVRRFLQQNTQQRRIPVEKISGNPVMIGFFVSHLPDPAAV